MIIVEGTDKAGKTTLINNLVKYFPPEYKRDIQISHFGLLPDDWDYCEDYLEYIKPNVILDRFIDSELAYGPVYRGKINSRLTTENLYKVYRKCLNVGTLVLYCNPDESTVFSRIQKEGDELIKKIEQLKALRNGFNKIYSSNYPLESMEINTSNNLTTETYKSIIKKSIDIWNKSRNLSNKNYRGFVNPSSKYLIYSKERIEETLIKLILESGRNIKDFSIIISRNIENKPVNVNGFLSSVNISKVFVIGEESMKDYKLSESSIKPVYLKHMSDFAIIGLQ